MGIKLTFSEAHGCLERSESASVSKEEMTVPATPILPRMKRTLTESFGLLFSSRSKQRLLGAEEVGGRGEHGSHVDFTACVSPLRESKLVICGFVIAVLSGKLSC